MSKSICSAKTWVFDRQTSTTVDKQLPGIDDPDQLDEFVAQYNARQPTDLDVVVDHGQQAADD